MTRAVFAGLALLLASCGDKALILPEDPIDRAASCGVIAAVQARAGTPDVQAPLSFEDQGRVLHFALLGGSEGGSFSGERAATVNDRMSVLQEKIIAGKWQDLVPACRQAYPAAARERVSLPEQSRQAQLGCDELGEFIGKAMSRQGVEYGNELAELSDFNHKIDQRIGGQSRKQTEERREALAAIAQSGPPMAVLRQCVERFG
jgi:hypothetical protein